MKEAKDGHEFLNTSFRLTHSVFLLNFACEMDNPLTHMTKICQLIKKKAYRDPDFTALKLAKMIGVRDYELSRILKKNFGKNFTTMVNGLRVKDAMKYLRDERLNGTTVEDVGMMAGFSNRQTFYSEFRKYAGCTPAQYRLSHKQGTPQN